MLETIIVLLVLFWAFGFWGPYHAHLGNFVHILIVVAVADKNERIAFFGKLYSFDVNFGDQRTGSIDHAEAAAGAWT